MGAGDSWHNGVNSVGHNCYCEEGIPISDGSGEEGTLLVQASAWDEGELLMMSTWGILRHALQGAGQAVQSMLVVTVT